jgi:SnoaL-like domain
MIHPTPFVAAIESSGCPLNLFFTIQAWTMEKGRVTSEGGLSPIAFPLLTGRSAPPASPSAGGEVIVIDKSFADHFAADWIASWNAHDLDRILSHYADDFEMSSPVIVAVVGEASGTLKGRKEVGAYWARALQLNPDLHFEWVNTLVGINSIALYYQGVRGLSAEVFHFNAEGKVVTAYAHYAQGD